MADGPRWHHLLATGFMFAAGGALFTWFQRLAKEASEESKEKLVGGRADGLTIEDFDQETIQRGMVHELEHTDDVETAYEIAMDHLAEDPAYYEKLSEAGL